MTPAPYEPSPEEKRFAAWLLEKMAAFGFIRAPEVQAAVMFASDLSRQADNAFKARNDEWLRRHGMGDMVKSASDTGTAEWDAKAFLRANRHADDDEHALELVRAAFVKGQKSSVNAALEERGAMRSAADNVPWDAATFVRSLPAPQALHEQLERTPFEYAVEVAEAVRARFIAERDRRQITVQEWAVAAFGRHCATNIGERVARVVEEAVELAQAEELLPETVQKIVEYVYGRPPGDPAKEAGGLGITLLAYCQARGMSADEAERQELERVLSKPLEHFAARHNAKADAGVAMPTDDKGITS